MTSLLSSETGSFIWSDNEDDNKKKISNTGNVDIAHIYKKLFLFLREIMLSISNTEKLQIYIVMSRVKVATRKVHLNETSVLSHKLFISRDPIYCLKENVYFSN